MVPSNRVVSPLGTVAVLRAEAARLRAGSALPRSPLPTLRPLPAPSRRPASRTARLVPDGPGADPPDLEPSAVGVLLTDAATVALASVETGHRAVVAAEVDVAEGSVTPDVAGLRSASRVLEQVARAPGEEETGAGDAADPFPVVRLSTWPVDVVGSTATAGVIDLPAAAATAWPVELAGVLREVWAGLAGRPELVQAAQQGWEGVATTLQGRATRLGDSPDGPPSDVRAALTDVLLAHAALCREVGALCVRVAAEVETTRARVAGWLGAPATVQAPSTVLPLPGAELLAERLEVLADLLEGLVVTGTAELGRLDAAGLALARAASLLRGTGDPGPPGATAPDSPTAVVSGPEPVALDHAVALVQQHWSAAASGGTAPPLPAGWRRVEPLEVGLDPTVLEDDRSGFAAAVFAGEAWVLSFAGTDFSGDLVADFLVEDLTGGLVLSPQVADVLALVDAVQGTALRDAVVWSGHSLGGRLAAVAAMASGDTAITFNAAGVSTATTGYVAARTGTTTEQLLGRARGGLVRAYRTEGDVVTVLQERLPTAPLLPDAPGCPLPLGRSVDGLVEGHLMPHVVREWERAHGHLLAGRDYRSGAARR